MTTKVVSADTTRQTLGPIDRVARIRSLDILRGVIMVLMAIDHVRVYSGLPAGGPTAGIFFTRWITHFCAPGFVFLAGTAAFLHGRKLGDSRALSRYLVVRGLMLVVLELTLIRFAWSFNFAYDQFILAGVIWMLGWCMIILAALIWLPAAAVGIIGVAIVILQQLFGLVPAVLPDSISAAVAPFWEFIYPAGADAAGGIAVLYVLVPWVGVMAAGYGFGTIMMRDAEARTRACLRIGLVCTALFLMAGSVLALRGADEAPFIFRLLNQQKYPASQLYLLMTLGPMIALIPVVERWQGRLADATSIIGRVPLFYYLMHIPLIHISALIVNLLRTGATHGEWYVTAPFTSVPSEQQWPLALLYLVFAVDTLLLYATCRWFAGVKTRSSANWLRYL